MMRKHHPARSLYLTIGFAAVLAFVCVHPRAAAQMQTPEDEIVANLAGGRVIVHVARDGNIVSAAINQPVEAGGVRPSASESAPMNDGACRAASGARGLAATHRRP